MGSELICADSNRPVWTGDVVVLLDALAWNPLSLLRSDLKPGRVIRTISPMNTDVYGQFLDALAKRGFVQGANFETFAYDWRRDLRETAEDFALAMRQVAAPEINIVAHSMGGLVVRLALLRHPEVAKRVRCYVQAGTPCRGSARAFETLKTGRLPIPLPGKLIQDLSQKLNPDRKVELMDSLRGMVSLYQLLTPPDAQILWTKTAGALSALDPRVWLKEYRNLVDAGIDLHFQLEQFTFDRMRTISESGLDTDAAYDVDGYFGSPRVRSQEPGDETVGVASSVFGTPQDRQFTLKRQIHHDSLLGDIVYQYKIFEELGIGP